MALPLLICLPPAGAGPSLFNPWRREDARVRAPGVAGREGRFSEAPPASLESLAEQLADDLAADLGAPFALFGYSMGGVVAYLLARLLAKRGQPGPSAIFVLGARAPQRLAEGAGAIAQLEGAAFWAEIARIGGTPGEVLDHAELRKLLEPGLRADFALCAAYRHRDDGFRIGCPLHLFIADDDHFVDESEYAPWRECAADPPTLHRLSGRHMLAAEDFLALRRTIRAL